MRDQDERTIIIERDSGGGAGAFLLGALIGAGVALLFAPKSGEETQKELREHADRLRAGAEERVRAASRQIEERLDEARSGVHDRVEKVKSAVEAGRTAARDARSDLENKLETSKAAYRAGVSAARATVEAGAEAESDPDHG